MAEIALERSGNSRQFFIDSYAIRALNVVYDLTKDTRFLDKSVKWSEQTVAFQNQMQPPGAYYMNYHREPQENRGEWYVADAASIALAVLSTAARVSDPKRKAVLLESVQQFADLVIDQFVRPSGGVTDGYWKKSQKEWWCSTAIFTSLLYQLYAETKEKQYLKNAQNSLTWLLNLKYEKSLIQGSFIKQAPAMLFYIFEAYSSALPYTQNNTALRQKLLGRFSEGVLRAVDILEGSAPSAASWWATKKYGLLFHIQVYLQEVAQETSVPITFLTDTGKSITLKDKLVSALNTSFAQAASQLGQQLFFDQHMSFALVALAELYGPGLLLRNSSSEANISFRNQKQLTAALTLAHISGAKRLRAEIKNHSFDAWENKLPVGWRIKKDQERLIKQSSEHSESALQLKASSKSLSYLYQKVFIDPKKNASSLILSADVIATEKHTCRLWIKADSPRLNNYSDFAPTIKNTSQNNLKTFIPLKDFDVPTAILGLRNESKKGLCYF
ncbi:MAG: hypothetical protein QGI45_17125, partial [Myxococcota bacterium]|nr:hypothetical protein [Myxococcota bacterium]